MRTFIAISDGVEVDVDVVLGEDEGEPRIKGVDGDDEEDANDPSLFGRTGIVAEMLVYLEIIIIFCKKS